MKRLAILVSVGGLVLAGCAYAPGASSRYGARLPAPPTPAFDTCVIPAHQPCGYVESYVPVRMVAPQYSYEVETVCCEGEPLAPPPARPPVVIAPAPQPAPPPPPPEIAPPATPPPPPLPSPMPEPYQPPVVLPPQSYPEPVRPLPSPLPLRK